MTPALAQRSDAVPARDARKENAQTRTAARYQANAPGVPYSFKYFQQVEGDLILPSGFKPVRVIARLVPQNGAAVEHSFPWSAAAPKQAGGA